MGPSQSFDDNPTGFIIKTVVFSLLGLLVLVFLFGSWGTISAGERGVKTRLGAVVGTVQPGFYLKWPIIEHVESMDVKTLTINYDKGGDNGDDKQTDTNLFGASKDLQDVTIGVVVNYHIDPAKVVDIYSQYSSVENYQSNVIEPIIRKTVKSMSASYTAEELVTKRPEFNDKVTASLSTQFAEKSAILEQANITNFQFSPEFTKAIEAKVTAIQNAEEAKNELERIKFEAQQTIETAKATAEAQRISAEALAKQGGADYVKLQWIQAWEKTGGHVPNTIIGGVGGSNNFLLNLDTAQSQSNPYTK
ncbi:MAG: prohibitin family protein [Candidatus Pacebacteria bacterium]|nr:prohibitin family protein [Candidatus Paceibacterota bacterium]